jgi:hypothetical protein
MLRVVRPANVAHVYYGFEDTSGKQFGATISEIYGGHHHLGKSRQVGWGVWYQVGLWTAAEDKESLNYKELRNPVDTVSEEAGAGRLRDCKSFLFTDNLTAEGCFY